MRLSRVKTIDIHFDVFFFDDPIALVSPVLGIGWVDSCENEFSTSMLRYKKRF